MSKYLQDFDGGSNIEFELHKRKKYYEFKVQGEVYKLLSISVEKFDLLFLDFINFELLEKILYYDEFMKAKNQAYRYLSLRDHFERELIDKLKNKDYSLNIALDLIESLRDEELLNDQKLAFNFAEKHLQTEGKNKVYAKLLKKGVKKEIINKAIEKFDFYEDDVCLSELNKKIERDFDCNFNLDKKTELKLVNFLKNKGFNTNSIIKAMRILRSNLDDYKNDDN